MIDERDKRQVITLAIVVVLMLLLFGPLFTIKEQYSGEPEYYEYGKMVTKNELDLIKNAENNLKNISFTKRKPSKDCSASSGNLCFSKPFKPTPISKAECNSLKLKLGIKECGYDDDVWAGAAKKCGGVRLMATPQELAYLAEYLYKMANGKHPKISPTEYYAGNAVFDNAAAKSLGLNKDGYLALWSNEEGNNGAISKPGEYAYGRNYFPKNSSWYPYERYGKTNNRMAVCVFRD